MRYRDFSLEGYEVAQFGTRVVLHLQREAPDAGLERVDIGFSDVALYHFIHTAGAIITDVEECTVPELLAEVGSRVVEWNQSLGVARWNNSLGGYRQALVSLGYRAWRIESAIGFRGFVIARSVDSGN